MAVRPRASRAAVEAVYEDCREDVEATAARFVRRYGGDYEDAVADANLYFLEAYHSYDPARGQLVKRIVSVVWGKLLDARRVEFRRESRHRRATLPETLSVPPAPVPFDARDLDIDPGTDAAVVVELVTTGVPELEAAMAASDPASPAAASRAVARYMRTRMRWTVERLEAAFADVRSALE